MASHSKCASNCCLAIHASPNSVADSLTSKQLPIAHQFPSECMLSSTSARPPTMAR